MKIALKKMDQLLVSLRGAARPAEGAAAGLSEAELAELGTILHRLQKEAADRLEEAKQLLREQARAARKEGQPTVEFRTPAGVVAVTFKPAALEADQELLTVKGKLPAEAYAKLFVEKTTVVPAKDFRTLLLTLPERQRPQFTRWVSEKAEAEPAVTFPK